MFLVFFLFIFAGLSFYDIPSKISYGVSFSKFHSDELGLEWKEVYLAILDDLKVKKLRLGAHWPMIEPSKGKFNFVELDYQMEEARKRGARVILAVGRRLPGWPECHDPDWVKPLSISERQSQTLLYIEAVVRRYRGHESLIYWQVENEPFLRNFSKENCGVFRKEFLTEEISLVRGLDPSHQILITDSGEISTWREAYSSGDIFGTSVYLYVWTHWLGPIRYPMTPAFFRAKRNFTELIYGGKPAILIELSTEPWLLKPIVDTDMSIIEERMSMEKFNNTISFAKKTSFREQYLWGAEWWYWMKIKDREEYWQRAKEIFAD